MNGKLSGWGDTIVALATPPGIGAIGVIRLSGSEAISIINKLFPAKDLSAQPTHTLHVGYLKNGKKVLDEVVIALYKGPKSYTGENTIEISCHGSPYIQQQIIDACIETGARLAKPGEFTQRAFLAGKLDLTQAEAVADLIASNTSASHKTALHGIRGGFSAALKDLRDQLLTFSALIELELDFSQEDVEFADRTRLKDLIAYAKKQIGQLLDSFRLGNSIRNGISVAIIGKPNAGKSTLLNTLLNEDRAIVSDIAGTTRDTIEEILNIEGLLFRLIDTAGIRAHSTDSIENAGMVKSRQKMEGADLVLYLFDATDTTTDEIVKIKEEVAQKELHAIFIANKIDTADKEAVQERFSFLPNLLVISAKEGLYLEELKKMMVNQVLQGATNSENVIVTNARHYHALAAVQKALTDVSDGMEKGIPADLIALDIRQCLHYLGEITGEITNEDQLDYIFSKFCIGK
ncbi:MAG: tRNA modification GTPase MnmE [Flaviaesturariibacter sp.]|nr:tRNA modification GTPase MnmE [Flaviaesturariibacter sp.]